MPAPQQETIRVNFISNDGAGVAGYVDVPSGTTVGQLMEIRVPGARVEGYTLRVNRAPATAGTPLNAGDRVSATPTQVKGATRS